MNPMSMFLIVCVIFVIVYDRTSYNTMRQIAPFYKKRNAWLLGYNTYMVLKTLKNAKRKRK